MSRRRGGGQSSFRPSTKRTGQGRAWNPRTDQSRTGTRGRGGIRTPSRLHTQAADQRVQNFYQRKQDENVPPKAWVRKDTSSSPKSNQSAVRSFSDVVKDQQAKLVPDETQKESSPAKDEVVKTLSPSKEQGGTSLRETTIQASQDSLQIEKQLKPITTKPAYTPSLPSIQPKPPSCYPRQRLFLSNIQTSKNSTTSSENHSESVSVYANGINAAVTDHNNLLRSQILDLEKTNQDLHAQLSLTKSELSRMQAEHFQEKRQEGEKTRKLKEKVNTLAKHIQNQGLDPESLETLTNSTDNVDRMMFLRERLLQCEEQGLAFQRAQRELLDKIQDQRVMLRQLLKDIRTTW